MTDHPFIIIAGLNELRIAELDTLASVVLDAVLRDTGGTAVTPAALTFLLHEYRATDRQDLGDGLGHALAVALDRCATDVTIVERAGWLTLFVETLAIADDERVRAAVENLLGQLRSAWSVTTQVDEGAVSIDACLRAAFAINPEGLIPAAVDELERIVGGAYQPGEGVVRALRERSPIRGALNAQVHSASAMLTAYDVAGRLPYAMLAEELMQRVRRDLANEPDCALNCEAALVLCRLAALHDDVDYCAAAVIAPDADYYADADRVLAAQSPRALALGVNGAPYGIALREFISLR